MRRTGAILIHDPYEFMTASQAKPDDDRLREPPVERFAAGEHVFDLRAEVESLKAEHAPSSRGHRQKTLYKRGNATIALFLFEAGGGLAQHKAAGTVTINVLDGRLILQTHGNEHVLTAGHVLVLAPGVEHTVIAKDQTVMLLQVHLDRSTQA